MLGPILAATGWDGESGDVKPHLDLWVTSGNYFPSTFCPILPTCLRRGCEAYFTLDCKVLGKVQVKDSMELLLLLIFYFSLPVN